MIDVVGVRFKKAGKIYYFNPNSTTTEVDDDVIVETVRGLEYGRVVIKKQIEETEIKGELKPVLRIATEEDKSEHIDNKNKAREAAIIFNERVEQHKLDMNLINAEYTFDKSKLLFYFTAEGRVDFRELVRDLATVFRTRIELRQIGVRDEAKVVGALGCCGRETCCSSFLSEFSPVSIKMAKDQGLSLNPTKISGVCGRLMCCLKYEQDGYECIIKRIPKIGEIVETDRGVGTVVSAYTIQELVKVFFTDDEKSEFEMFDIKEVKRTRKFNKAYLNSTSQLKEEEAKPEELQELERE